MGEGAFDTKKSEAFAERMIDVLNSGALALMSSIGHQTGLFDTMKHILKMDMVGDTLRLKSSSLGGGLQMAQDYGRQIAKKLGG